MRDPLGSLPDGYKVVDFSMVHYFLINLNPIHKEITAAHPDYKTWLASMVELGPAFTCLHEGHPIFCCGICHILPGVAEGWMLADISLPQHSRPFARRARAYYDRIGTDLGVRRLQFTVVARDVASIRFAEWLRFEHEGTLRAFAPNGENILMMSRLYL